MKFQKKIVELVSIQFVCGLFITCSAVQVPIENPNYKLDYEIIHSNSSIEFRVQAINVTGWVGLGINNRSDMVGADIFIGGHHANNDTGYGKDYHVPSNSENTRPTLDTEQNWELVTSAEAKNITTFTVRRLLDTTDTDQDRVIENKKIYLLWSYSWVIDDVSLKEHDSKGSITFNLLSTANSGASSTNLFAYLQLIVCLVITKVNN